VCVLLEDIESADGRVTCVFFKVQMGLQSNTTIYVIIRRSKPVVDFVFSIFFHLDDEVSE